MTNWGSNSRLGVALVITLSVGLALAGITFDPALAQDKESKAEIVATLTGIKDDLSRAKEEYSLAVVNGTIKEQEEYDEAIGFLSKATTAFKENKAAFSSYSSDETAELEVDLATIDTQIKGKASPTQVSDTIAQAVKAIDEIVAEVDGGPAPAEKNDGWEILDRTKAVLDKAVQEYKNGNFTQARSTVLVQAYLENYELLEKDIEEDNKELMEKIETDIKVKLVQMIDDRKPLAEIQSQVDAIKTDLETSRAVVTPEFPLVAALAASVMALVVLIGRFKRPQFLGRV